MCWCSSVSIWMSVQKRPLEMEELYEILDFMVWLNHSNTKCIQRNTPAFPMCSYNLTHGLNVASAFRPGAEQQGIKLGFWANTCRCRNSKVCVSGTNTVPQLFVVVWGGLPTQECLGLCLTIQTDHVCSEVDWIAGPAGLLCLPSVEWLPQAY